MTEFIYKPLTTETWKSFETLFGPRGACGGCWCMTWRLHAAEFQQSKGEKNKLKIKKLVSRGEPVGILAFDGNVPVGWSAVAPREKYVRLEKSRALRPVDDQQVWSVSCFFITKAYRRKGLSVKLLHATVEYAASFGARIIEGYPIDGAQKKIPDVFAWTGILSSYRKAGFVEEKRHAASRPIVRFYL